MRNDVPSVFDWVRRLDDASGVDGDWHQIDSLRPEVSELLKYAAKYYLPFLKANSEAYAAGDDQLELELAGQPFVQATFKYQVKCYDRLRKRFSGLGGHESKIETLLGDTGCLEFLV